MEQKSLSSRGLLFTGYVIIMYGQMAKSLALEGDEEWIYQRLGQPVYRHIFKECDWQIGIIETQLQLA